MTSIFSIFGEWSGNVRSTPTPNDCLRTVNVSRAPEPCRLMHDPLEHLDAAPLPLDHLEVDANGVARLEPRHVAQLGALDESWMTLLIERGPAADGEG